ncbi:hypothetical protein AAHA92_14121 [Salvia divinorum]|uniref:Uncharacterized protein n=1 Tax=Salvia divinorum TaxID=28513 RepID=A0ABD1HAI3_SALDI
MASFQDLLIYLLPVGHLNEVENKTQLRCESFLSCCYSGGCQCLRWWLVIDVSFQGNCMLTYLFLFPKLKI